jgi:hypothetical protein
MQEVTYVTMGGTGLQAVGITDKGVDGHATLLDARAAIVPPTGDNDGYYLIMGQKSETMPTGKQPLLFLGEGSHVTLGALLKNLSDDISRLKVSKIYVDRSCEGFFRELWDRFQGYSYVSVVPAPFVEDEEYGIALIRDWLADKAIEIPKFQRKETIVRRQLESMTSKTLGVVAHALRFLVGGFERDIAYYEFSIKPEIPYYYD